MILRFKHTHILIILHLFIVGCRQTKYVPQGKYLLKKNDLTISSNEVSKDEFLKIIRQQPNYKSLGLKLKLWAYNRIDSSSVAQKRYKKNIQLRQHNHKKIDHQRKINERRKQRARTKGKKVYTEKIVELKDTANPRLFFREWFKYKIGEKPVIFDSLLFSKTLEQLNIFLRNKGYYRGSVTGNVVYLNRKKARVSYSIETGQRFRIDSVYTVASAKSASIKSEYKDFVRRNPDESLLGKAFDKDILNTHRDNFAKTLRNNAYYGFSSSLVSYVADTSYSDMTVNLGIVFSERMVRSQYVRDSLIPISHKTFKMKKVFFHIADTAEFKGNFKTTIDSLRLPLYDQQFVSTIDTLIYKVILKKDEKDKKRKILDPYRFATFTYNGELKIDPSIIELQNYLEQDNFYKEYYLDRTYNRLMQLGLFQVIKPVIIENPPSNLLEVHYYLVPSQRQSFSFEPRTTNSNGFLGVSSSLNYVNKNLFGGAEKFTFSIGGGFESQPPIFDESLDGEKIKKAGRSFNTFEIGPLVKFEVPGLFPAKPTLFSKRQRPRTVISAAYNYQRRADFTRHNFQLNYTWKWLVAKTQVFQIGLPGMSSVRFVNIEKSVDFNNKLNQLNDLFLRNAYSNQFIWQDLKLVFEYNNKDKDKKGPLNFYFVSSLDLAGNTISLFKSSQDTLSNGQHAVFGVPYSQFMRLDNEVICSFPLPKKTSLNGRVQAGVGIPYGNTQTSLPYDYAFFAGGANDNRGWRARALAPGAYKYYLDTNRTATQISDIRLGASLEYRFNITDLFKGALFMDAGNTWTYNEDINRIGSQFSSNWFREIALSAGLGVRIDLDFFILRLDLGLPLTNPALPLGERWIFNRERPEFLTEGITTFGLLNYKKYLPKPFIPCFHFGIGFPF